MATKKQAPDQVLERAIRSSGSQAEVARQLGVSRQAVNQWIAGSRPIPIERLENLASLGRR